MKDGKKKEYVTIYFDLWADPEDDQSLEAEDKARKEAADLLSNLTEGFQDEGHDDEVLCCKFSLEKKRMWELQELIDRQRGGDDDNIYLFSGLVIGRFLMIGDFEDGEVLFCEWDFQEPVKETMIKYRESQIECDIEDQVPRSGRHYRRQSNE